VNETEAKLLIAEEKVRLFNNREALFNAAMTDYERVGAIRKSFEPYSNLWGTTQKWLQNHDQWVNGSFQNLDAEVVEKDVDVYFNTISKAVKFFEREQKEQQGGKLKCGQSAALSTHDMFYSPDNRFFWHLTNSNCCKHQVTST